MQACRGALLGVVVITALASCGADVSDGFDPSEGTRAALPPSPEARDRIAALKERMGMRDSIATTFERSGESVRALNPEAAKRSARSASVELPSDANGFATVEDDASQLSVRFALKGAVDVPLAVADGMALYAGALGGADVVHRPHAEGTEDFVVFEERPTREELYYRVDVSRVAGLRLVSNTLEFLDDAGAPRLRVAPPYVIEAGGQRQAAKLAVDGCAYDVDPAAPSGRPVTSPGAASCTVRVAWERVAYPAVVDPNWTATGSMAEGRGDHTASVLASGKVLVTGGASGDGEVLATAELYDPTTGTFSATGSMVEARTLHTASVLASGNVLVAGGSGSPSTAELYDPVAGIFSATGSMAEGRYLHTASVLASGEVLVAGGISYFAGIPGYAPSPSAELYDPMAGTFSVTGSMAQDRRGHTASVLQSGRVLVAGGSTDATAEEIYDPAVGTFSPTGAMAQYRFYHTASLLESGHVLVAGGSGSATTNIPDDPVATAELYDPTAGTFSPAGSMEEARKFHTATVLESGQVLVGGGSSSAIAELYDPAANTFLAAGSMVEARTLHTASVLGSGDILVAGGNGNATGYLATAELYDTPRGAGGEGGGGPSQGGGAAASQGGGGAAASRGGAVPVGGCGCNDSRSSSQPPVSAFAIALAIAAWRRRRVRAAGHSHSHDVA